MGFLDRFRRKSNIESKSIEIPVDSGSLLGYAFQAGYDRYNNVSRYDAMRIYRRSSAVATAVDMIAEAVEDIEPVIKLPDGKFTNKSPVLDFLKMPNDYEQYQQFIGSAVRHRLLTMDSFLYVGGTLRGKPAELYAVKPQNVNSNTYEYSYASSYYVTQGMGKGNYERKRMPKLGMRYYDGTMQELFRIGGFSSRVYNDFADSPLSAICLEIYHQIKSKTHNLSVIENGGRLSLLVTFKDDPTDEEIRERKKHINESWGGSGNAGSIGYTRSADMDVQEFGKSNKDMDFMEMDRISREIVFSRYEIPLPFISTDASTYNNMENAVYHFYDRPVLRSAQAIFDGLGRLLLPRFGLDPMTHKITYNIEQIPALMSRRLQQLENRKKLNIETTNELREDLPNREPIQGGDTLYQPGTLVPVGQDIYTQDNTTTEEEQRRQLEND